MLMKIFTSRERIYLPRAAILRYSRWLSSMREHDGIIKIESLLVKSSDEREISGVALREDFTSRCPKMRFPKFSLTESTLRRIMLGRLTNPTNYRKWLARRFK